MAKSIDFKKLTRKQFLRELAEFADQQRDLIETSVEGFSADPQASKRRVERGASDFRYFGETYFPHYLRGGDPSVFQAWIYGRFLQIVERPGALQAFAAPRGEGKSTLCTQIGCIYLIVYGLAHMIPIIMGSTESAQEMLEVVKAELEVNPRLRMDFPDAVGKGRIWRAGVIITANNVKVKAYGAQKRLRGARHGPWRPDFAFVDDLENDENVRSKEQRDKLEQWVRTAVLNVGPPDGSMRVIYAGTVLHYDSVLKRFMKSPLWRGDARIFQSIVVWPDRMDLWDDWETILKADGQEAAAAFYNDKVHEMEAGAVVSWPGVRTLYQLMLKRADDHKAFDKEQQNDPTAGEDCPFADAIHFWVHPCRDWVFFGAHDPSMGKKARRGDPAATLVGGFDRVHGKLSVVEAKIRRRLPNKQIDDIIDLQAEYNCLVWGIEAVAFQEFFRMELVKCSAERGQPVPARPINSDSDKDLRIESLQPHCANGLIMLHRSQITLIEQLKHWPEADHDDGPDCLEMLWQLALKGVRSSEVRAGKRQSIEILQGYSDG